MGNDILSKHDRSTPTAKNLIEYYSKRLGILRAKNDECPLERTEKLRGRIREVKNLLNVLAPKLAFKTESDDME